MDPVTGLTNSNGNAVYVRDPFYTGGSIVGKTNFTGSTAQLNVLPVGRIDPNAVKLLSGSTRRRPRAGWSVITSLPQNSRRRTIPTTYRIDETINAEEHSCLECLTEASSPEPFHRSLPGLAVGETGGRNDSFPAYAFAVGYTTVFTPTLTNEMHVGMVHSDKFQSSIYGNTFGIPAKYGIGGVPQVANNGGIPPINFGSRQFRAG